MVDKSDAEVDKTIEKLLDFKGNKSGKLINLQESQIRTLCLKSKEIFLS